MATIDGTAGDDTLIGTANRDTIYGNGGYDLIYGGAADDFIYGATPYDMTEVAASTIDAGDGDDFVVLDNGDDVLIGGNGLDTLQFRSGGPGDLTLDLSITTAQNTGYGNKTISGFENLTIWENINVNFTGNAADNQISTRGGIDTIYGLGGNDVISVQNGDDYVNGGAGDDRVTVEGANNTVYGGTGNDYVFLRAGTGNNLIDLGAGDNDTLRLEGQFGTFDARNTVTPQNDTIRGVEEIQIYNYGTPQSLTFYGSDSISRYDFWHSGVFNAVLGAGNDTVDSYGLGDSTILGGAGNDSIQPDHTYGNLLIDAGVGDDIVDLHWIHERATVLGGAGNDTINAIWSYVAGSDGYAATLNGGAGNDLLSGGYSLNPDDDDAGYRLEGGGGNDTLRGYDFDDFLIGGAGADSMYGNDGDDIYVVDHAGDIVAEGRDAGHDLVRSTVSFTLGTYVEDLTLRGTRAIDGTGNALANTIRGNDAANSLNGLDGNDLLIGGDGDDTLNGWAGIDTLKGGAGNDTYITNGNEVIEDIGGIDLVRSGGDFWLGADLEHLTLMGTAIAGDGNYRANRLTGNTADNVLDGRGGNDTLIGGAGNDTLMGGLGTDRFVFHSGHDVVTDFETGTDILRIDDAVWGGTPRSAADLVAAAQVTGSGVLFHFGADDSILLEGLTSKAGLEDDLTIF